MYSHKQKVLEFTRQYNLKKGWEIFMRILQSLQKYENYKDETLKQYFLQLKGECTRNKIPNHKSIHFFKSHLKHHKIPFEFALNQMYITALRHIKP